MAPACEHAHQGLVTQERPFTRHWTSKRDVEIAYNGTSFGALHNLDQEIVEGIVDWLNHSYRMGFSTGASLMSKQPPHKSHEKTTKDKESAAPPVAPAPKSNGTSISGDLDRLSSSLQERLKEFAQTLGCYEVEYIDGEKHEQLWLKREGQKEVGITASSTSTDGAFFSFPKTRDEQPGLCKGI